MHRLIVVFLTCAATAALAQDFIRSTTLQCGDTRVEAESVCFDDSYRPFTRCTEQRMRFHARDGTRREVHAGAAQAAKPGERPSVEFLIGSIACVRTGAGLRVEATLRNGGNCDQCEQVRWFTLDGKSADGRSAGKSTIEEAHMETRRR